MGTKVSLSRDDLPDSDLVDALATKLIGGDLSEGTRSAIEARLAGEGDTDPVVLAAGLILGSPEFQRQ
jgi:hypothetical protein